MKRKNTEFDRQGEKRSAIWSTVLSTLLQLMTVGALLYLRSVTQTEWLRGLMFLLAAADLITIPFTFKALWQRVQEIEKGELDEARKY